MPQMMPMKWLFIHFLILVLLMLTMNLIYFMNFQIFSPFQASLTSFNWNWKW